MKSDIFLTFAIGFLAIVVIPVQGVALFFLWNLLAVTFNFTAISYLHAVLVPIAVRTLFFQLPTKSGK